MDFLYDESGSPYSLIYDGVQYYYVKNLQGDVVQIRSSYGTLLVEYAYDAWGKVLSISGSYANTLGVDNPIRYRSYYYDFETGFYYLQSRYYDPAIRRFINADGYVNANGGFIGYNMYTYCSNSPIVYKDPSGNFLDTVFDIISIVASVVDVIKEPSDPLNWLGLAGDVVDLIPFVTCVGETVRAVKIVDNVVDAADTVHDVSKVVDNVGDAAKTIDRTAEATTTVNKVKKVHGNSLSSKKTNYGYALVDQDNNIMKFGETVNPGKRYSKKFLEQNGYTMKILDEGSKMDIHYWQHDMNMYYKNKYGSFPPLNKKGW